MRTLGRRCLVKEQPVSISGYHITVLDLKGLLEILYFSKHPYNVDACSFLQYYTHDSRLIRSRKCVCHGHQLGNHDDGDWR